MYEPPSKTTQSTRVFRTWMNWWPGFNIIIVHGRGSWWLGWKLSEVGFAKLVHLEQYHLSFFSCSACFSTGGHGPFSRPLKRLARRSGELLSSFPFMPASIGLIQIHPPIPGIYRAGLWPSVRRRPSCCSLTGTVDS